MWRCRDDRVCIHGPAGTGKSRGVLEKVHLAAMKYPRMQAAIGRKIRADLTQSVLQEFEEQVTQGDPRVRRIGGDISHRIRYDYPNGSQVWCFGMDNASRIMSTQKDLIACFEATEFSAEDIDFLDVRCRAGNMPYQQLICDTNPRGPNHHLKRAMDSGKMTGFAAKHQDNPRFWDMLRQEWTEEGTAYLRRLDRLEGPRRAWLLDGRWIAASGVVYGGFDYDTHIISTAERPFVIPPEWRRIRVIDFGYEDPFVCQWWAIDPEGRAYMYREIYHTHRLVADHAWQIKVLSEGEKIEATISDHSRSERATLAACGIDTIPAKKSIVPGIQKVMRRLQKAADGQPRMRFLDNALVERDKEAAENRIPCQTTEEFDCYVFREREEERKPDEEPIDKDNHGMDCCRYLAAHLDGLDGAIRVFPSGDASVIRANIQRPMFIGSVDFMPGDQAMLLRTRTVCGHWRDADAGPWNLWCTLDPDEKGRWRPPQEAVYSIGTASALTSEGYRSVVCVSRRETREQVAELVTSAGPEELARLLAMAGYWFGGLSTGGCSFLVWEGNPIGTVMGRELLRLGYPWPYYHTETDKRNAKPGDKYGWKPSDERAQRLMLETRRMIATNAYRLRSEETATACERMIVNPNGELGPWEAADEPEHRESSLVRLRAIAMSLSAMGMEGCAACSPPKRQASPGSIAHEEERLEAQRAKNKNRWW